MMEQIYTIEKLDHQGRGIIRENGMVIFVENALPNEQVEIQVVKEKKNLKEAKVLNYHKQSFNRITPRCPYYKECGGCHVMHIPYKRQLEWKIEKVKEIMMKFVNSNVPIQEIVASEEWNYRNKATFQVRKEVGYFKEKSNLIVPIESCDLVDKKIQKLLSVMTKLDLNGCSQVIVRASKNQTMVILKINNNFNLTKMIENLSSYVNSIYIKGKKLECIYGEPYIEEKIGDFLFRISPDSFFQVNTNQAKKLYDIVLNYASVTKEDSILDLYCGTGTIGLYVSPYCHKVLGVEINKQAIIDARENQKRNHIDNAEFICSDVATIVDKIKGDYSVIIVDPPRSGLDEKTLFYLKSCNAKRIVYVSCDPVTLARDLNGLKEIYHIEELTPVDMFPQTYHVECVALMSRIK